MYIKFCTTGGWWINSVLKCIVLANGWNVWALLHNNNKTDCCQSVPKISWPPFLDDDIDDDDNGIWDDAAAAAAANYDDDDYHDDDNGDDDHDDHDDDVGDDNSHCDGLGIAFVWGDCKLLHVGDISQ